MPVYSSLPILRQCGECTACCTRLPIPPGIVSLEAKPAGAPCPHLCQAGCSIYALRPDICSRFQCAWLADGAWPGEWRPDRSGLLCLREILADGYPAALVMEARPGALLEPLAEAILLRLLQGARRVVVIAPDGSRHLMHGSYDPPAAAPQALAA